MKAKLVLLASIPALLGALPLYAASNDFSSNNDSRGVIGDRAEDPPYLQCVPYARDVSGIRIFGDAHTWWDQAAGRYARGNRPKVGAVMSFRPFGNMRLGHVAAVSRVLDNRTVLLRHSNWSPIGGRRGQIENDVRAIDVSPANDWSEVRVWFAPIQNLGTTHWPLNGFIYPGKAPDGTRSDLPPPLARTTLAVASKQPKDRPSRIGADFLKGIAPEKNASKSYAKLAAQAAARPDPRTAQKSAPNPGRRPASRTTGYDDPIGALIAARS